MKRALFLLVFGLFFFFVSLTTVYAALDPPHNESSGIGCSDCHGMSIVQSSPFWTTNRADAAFNSICASGRCHGVDDPGPPYGGPNAPQIHSHSPEGPEIKCTDCHNNHDQDQIYSGKNNKSQFFIATVTANGAPTYNSGDDTTDIPYNPATWSGIGKWSDPSLLDEKTNSGRGAQLVPDRNSRRRWPIYMVKTVNTGTNVITVKGNVSAATNIGMFYGQLIRKVVNGTDVKFWNDNGSFTFTNTSGTGICQVCHTSTNHFQSTPGAAPGGDTHNNGADCMICHDHLDADTNNAFKVTGPDHETDGLVTRDAGCGACHAGDVLSGSDMHESDCTLCHEDPGSGDYTLIDQATSTRVTAMPDGGTPAGTDGGGTCIQCHGDHDTDWYFHEVDHVTKGWVTPNTDTSSNTVNCVNCHTYTGNENILLTVHDQVTQSGVRATICQQCHLDADKSLQGSASGHAELDGGFGNPNQCNTCHSAHFEDHNHHDSAENDVTYEIAGLDGNAGATADNDTSQSTETGCAECHDDLTGTNLSLDTWTGIAYEHDLDGTKNGVGACVSCHDYDGSATPVQGTVETAITSGDPASCATCHTDKVPNVDHGGHPADDFNYTAACQVCHIGSDVVATVHSNKCTVCHGAGYVRIDGDPTNGVDGDARLADALGDPRADATCLTCHPNAELNATAGDWQYATMHHDGLVGYATPTGNCTICHTGSTFVGDHTSTTSLATNCQDCHTTTPVAVNNIDNGDNKKHDVCTSCHTIDTGDNYYAKLIDPASSTLVTAMPDGGDLAGTNGGGDCEACHTATFVGYHATLDHDPMVDNYVNCSTCHSGTEAPTPGPVPLDPADPAGNKKHDACTTCHNAANGQLSGSAAGKDGATAGGSDGGGSCDVCHGEYFDSHTNIDHTSTVALDSDTSAKNDCFDCHDGTQGTSTTVPLDATSPAGDKLHDSCSTCHTTTGILTGTSAIATAMPNGVGGDGGKDGGSVVAPNGCQACHGDYFDSHVHGNDGNHDLTYTAGVDLSQDAPGTPCASCHTPTGTLTTWTGVLNEHSGSCSTCHDYSGATTADGTPPVNLNDTTIASGTSNTCVTCHDPKKQPATHGEHETSHFSWDSNCVTCHFTTNNYVVQEVHSDDCTICHNGTPNRDSEKEGDPTNGIDGDARWANNIAAGTHVPAGGDWTLITCTTCHPNAVVEATAGDWKYATMHHDAVNNYATGGSCTICHTGSTFTGDHATMTSLATNCADCHSTTPVAVNNVDNGDAKKHDACTTCHFVDATTTGEYLVKLNDPASLPLVTAMPDNGTLAGTDGGGDCEACHTSTFVGYHAAVDHDAVVNLHTDCTNCHSGTEAPTPGPVPLDGGDDKKHDACTACHDAANGRLSGSATGNNGGDNGGSNGGGDCNTCHTDFFANHTATVSHDPMVNLYANCSACHTGTEAPAGAFVMYPVDPKKHDACTSCHNADGTLTGSATGNNGATLGGSDGGGTCFTCHGEYMYSHTNADHQTAVDIDTNTASKIDCVDCHSGTEGTSSTVPLDGGDAKKHDACSVCHNLNGSLTGSASGNTDPNECVTCHTGYFTNHSHVHDVSYDSLTDLSQVSMAGDNPCGDCHDGNNADGNGTPLDSWTDIRSEHLNNCSTCHDYSATATGTPPQPLTDNTIGSGTGVECVTCHTPKLDPAVTSDHGGHEDPDTYIIWTGAETCRGCHDQGSSVTDMIAFHGVTGAGTAPDGCGKCHANASGGGALIAVLEGDATAKDGGKCQDCHNGTLSLPNIGNVHGLTAATVGSSHNLSSDSSGGYDCEACHAFADGEAQLLKHMDDTDTTAGCLNCHTAADATSGASATGVVDTAVGQHAIAPNSWDTDTANTAVKCENCHAQKDDYDRHGLSDVAAGADSADSILDPVDNPSTASPAYHDKVDGGSTGFAVDYTNVTITDELNTYGGLTTTRYNCGDCHGTGAKRDKDNVAGNTKAFSNLEALQLHTSKTGSGSGDCLTCHVQATALTGEIAVGQGGTSVTCEDCHDTVNGNGPSGKAMYQYDGTRHHTTDHAQAGDCTWCHADPRPTSIDNATYGYAFSADGAGADDYSSGWNAASDYNLGETFFPKQLACRLCHTNYEEYSVNVNAGIDADTNTDETNDLHGYHITASSKTTVDASPNLGLVVYENRFGSADAVSYPSGNGNPDVQLTAASRVLQDSMSSHRITSTSKISVYDYGACLSCHSIQYFHAAPIAPTDYPTPTNANHKMPYDTLRYAPGRSIFNILPGGGFNGTTGSDNCGSSGSTGGNNTEDWDQHCEPDEYSSRGWQTDRAGADADGLGRRTWNGNPSYNEMFNSVAGSSTANGDNWYMEGTTGAGNGFTRAEQVVHSSINDYEGLSSFPADGNALNIKDSDSGLNQSGTGAGNNSGGIVIFADITAPSVDDIVIEKAEWDGSTLTVWASSTNGDPSNLTFTTSNSSCSSGGGEPYTMTWVGGNSRHEDTTCTDLTFASGVSLTVTSATGTTKTAAIAYVYSGPVAATGVADPGMTSADTGGPYALDVLANDIGTSLNVVGISSVTKDSGAGTCGTIQNDTTSIGYTPGSGNAVCDFTYDVQSLDIGPADTGVAVTVTQTSNSAPTITVNQPDGVGDTGTAGGSFTIDYDANDTDGTISVDFYYDNNNSGEDGTAIASCQNLTPEGTGLTCSWTSLPAGTWYVYGIVTDNDTATATDYSSGTIVVSATPPFADATYSTNMDSYGGTLDAEAAGNPGATFTVDGSNWTALSNDADNLNCWFYGDDGGTGSTGTGPCDTLNTGKCATAGADIWLYLETSASPGCATSQTNNRIESAVLDASTYSFTVSFSWSMNVENNTDAVLRLMVYNGITWVTHQTIQTGSAGDVWNNTGAIDLSAYTNADMQVRIEYLTGILGTSAGGDYYRNDIAIDDLVIDGTP